MARVTQGVRVQAGGDTARLTRSADTLGDADVNILGFSVHGPQGDAYVIPEDSEKSIGALREEGIEGSIVDVVTASLPNRPGELGRASHALSDAGVAVEAVFPAVAPSGPDVRVAVVCEDTQRAAKALEGLESQEHPRGVA